MIRNQREYRITKARIAEFEKALTALRPTRPGVHPILQKAQQDAVASQLDDLREELADYDALVSGSERVLEVASLDELPVALIRARISSGMTQKQLAEKLGVAEQQVQRYEAQEYDTASLARLREVVAALGIKLREDLFLPHVDISAVAIGKRLKAAGIPSGLLERRIFDDVGEKNPLLGLENAQRAGRVFGWSTAELVAGNAALRPASFGAPAFKLPSKTRKETVVALATYSRFVAGLVLRATPKLHRAEVPRDAGVVRDAVVDATGHLSLKSLLSFLWAQGVPVIPLDEPGGFHGAFWRIAGRNVVVLKQKTSSESRWVFDLLHETFHAGAPRTARGDIEILDMDTKPSDSQLEEEERAMQFAGSVLLDGRAEEIAGRCVTEARGSLERLKSVVPSTARATGVDVSAVANYLAYRLSMQGLNWWGAATNLQSGSANPWQIARDFLVERLDLSQLGRDDRSLLRRALEPEVST